MPANEFSRCTVCGTESLVWRGQCSECGKWATLEKVAAEHPVTTRPSLGHGKGPQPLNRLLAEPLPSLFTGSMGDGPVAGRWGVPGSLTLCVGDPGIGKSTLALQMAGQVAAGGTVLCASGEESEAQMPMRAVRLGAFPDTLYVVAETRLERIGEYVSVLSPVRVIIDSIQRKAAPGVEMFPGSKLWRNHGEIMMKSCAITPKITVACWCCTNIIDGQLGECGLNFQRDRWRPR